MARLVLFLSYLFVCKYVGATTVSLQSDPGKIIQGLSPSLTLNCTLSDDTAVLIGKRDVTQSSDSLVQVSSLVIMKDGNEVASVNTAQGPHVMDGSTNIQVSGSFTGSKGSIVLSIKDPSVNQTGDFVCEANGVNTLGHSVTLKTETSIPSSPPTTLDLVNYVKELREKNEILEQTVALLKNRSDAMVLFNARVSGHAHYGVGSDVIFDNVQDNIGNDYDGSNGHFTCEIPGVYDFSIGCLSYYNSELGLDLYHNGQSVFSIYGPANNSYETGAHSGAIKLDKGDIVKVSATYDSTLDGSWCSFSGHLVQAF